ncbi:hypothetical protein N7533_013582, partial [Penicillium manginii]|uniref:uncharacterized protein n=1 Tax=Penicillium manginii TaxID=203109 RepID=UPI0025481194
ERRLYLLVFSILSVHRRLLGNSYFPPAVHKPPWLNGRDGSLRNIVKGGTFTWHINCLHDQYGPIFRIKPNELHIKDPDYYNNLYTGLVRIETRTLGLALSAFLGPSSQQATMHFIFEPIIRANTESLCQHFSASSRNHQALELHTAFDMHLVAKNDSTTSNSPLSQRLGITI